MDLYNTQPKEVWLEGNTITDDIQPRRLVERTTTYHAPFDCCNREKDNAEVWANFERQFQEKCAK